MRVTIRRVSLLIKRNVSKTFLFLADIITINMTLFLAMHLHYEGQIPAVALELFVPSMVLLTLGKLLIYRLFGLYDSLWAYASIEELIKVVKAVFVANVVGVIYLIAVGFNVYLGIYFIAFVLEILFIGGSRFSYRMIRRMMRQKPLTIKKTVKKVMIIGCGATASMIATEIKNHPEVYGQVVGYVDDDASKHGKSIAGIKVLQKKVQSLCFQCGHADVFHMFQVFCLLLGIIERIRLRETGSHFFQIAEEFFVQTGYKVRLFSR